MTMRLLPRSLALLACGLASVSLAEETSFDGPLTPAQAPRAFRLEPGLRIELVAAEPMIESPSAMAFDEFGRLFVAENRGYPTGPGEGQPPQGRIALLTDTDGDGDMDERTTFAEGLTFPNGLLPWNGGLIVTCAPEILFLRDTNGDGRADEREVWFTGFSTAGSTQLRVSHPTLGFDNWIYVTSGLTGGKVVNPQVPDRPPVELGRTDFRFRPDRSAYEAADGGAQFGMTFDDFGRRFICYNRVQVQHVVLTAGILRRQPQLAFSETVQNCPAEMVAEPSRGHGPAARLFPISSNVTTADSHAGTFTAACGVTVYRGDGLPDEYTGGVFACDPTGNLVHFDRLDPAGATFSARRVREGIEFLASTDNWFRPVFLSHGPDGALYVCDMYRKTIEHPDYLPVEIRKHTDFSSGKDRGRIWRVVSSKLTAEELAERRKSLPGSLPVAALCELLRDQNGWRRETARRLLLARNDPVATAPLQKIAADIAERPAPIAAAVSLLEARSAIDDSLLDFLVAHPAPELRELALRLAEPRLLTNTHLLDHAVHLAADEDPQVRFQAAIALGACDAARLEADERLRRDGYAGQIAEALAAIGVRGGGDRWMRAAVLSSTHRREEAVLAAVAAIAGKGQRPDSAFLFDLARLTASSVAPETASQIITGRIETPFPELADQLRVVSGFALSFRQRAEIPADGNILRGLVPLSDNDTRRQLQLDGLVDSARRLADNRNQPIGDRAVAVEFLGHAGWQSTGTSLLALLEGEQPLELQLAAVRALVTMRQPQVSAELLNESRFDTFRPALRDEILGGLLTNPVQTRGLLAAVEAGQIPPIAIDAFRRRQLTSHSDPEIRGLAQKLFGAVAGDRAAVYESLKDVVDLQANPANGRLVFKRVCANCHRLDREGFAVGPDLFSIRNQPKAAILLHILVPDQEITEGFTAYTILTRDGRTLTGLIAAETPNSITLRMQQGKEESLLRSDLDEIVAAKVSLMPQGVEKDVTRQEFADLLAYLKGEQ